MKFLSRALAGLVLVLVTLALVGAGAWRLTVAMMPEEEGSAPGRAAYERTYAVEVATLRPAEARPVLVAYGRLESARMLELRAPRAGRIEALAPSFRDGARVEAGALLFRLDPADADGDLARADIALEEAEADARIAAAAAELARRDLSAARVQRDLRANALERARDLRGRGVGTEAAVETAELALSAAEQQALAREQALADAEARAERAAIDRRRAEVALSDARRARAETERRAPFAGVLADTDAALGRRVTAGERLATLIDPEALEAVVDLSADSYARLAGPDGDPRPLSARVRRDPPPADAASPAAEPPAVGARLARAGAAPGMAGGGRRVWLALGDGAAAADLRAGDFVRVAIEEPPLSGVAVLPAGAATLDGRILVVGDDDRLEEVQVSVLRREGDRLIVEGAPFDRPVVLRRRPQLSDGVKVRPVDPGAPDGPTGDADADADDDPAGRDG